MSRSKLPSCHKGAQSFYVIPVVREEGEKDGGEKDGGEGAGHFGTVAIVPRRFTIEVHHHHQYKIS